MFIGPGSTRTTLSSEVCLHALRLSGMNDMLVKPFRLEGIRRILDRWLDA